MYAYTFIFLIFLVILAAETAIVSFLYLTIPRFMIRLGIVKFFRVDTHKRSLTLLVASLLVAPLAGVKLSLLTKSRNEEVALRNELTKEIIDAFPIPSVDVGQSQRDGFKFEYLSVQDSMAGENVDNVYNVVWPMYCDVPTADIEIGRECLNKRGAINSQLRVKPNPDYVAEGATAVLEIDLRKNTWIRNKDRYRLGYMLVNDKEELQAIKDNITGIGTIVVLMRFIGPGSSYRTSGGQNAITLYQEGMSIYFYDVKNGVVFDNFTIISDSLPDEFKNFHGGTSVTTHVDTINGRLKTNLKGKLSVNDI